MESTLSRLRTVAIVAVLGIAVTHVFELPDKLEESGVRYQGVLFIALILGCVALAALARRIPESSWWAGVLSVSVLPLVAFVISRTAGLPGGEDDIGAWAEPSGIASMAFEALAIVVAARAMPLISSARERVSAAPRSQARRPTRTEPLGGRS
jgi:asparagine N-glycosylation enzyme membrane subunit Stt3